MRAEDFIVVEKKKRKKSRKRKSRWAAYGPGPYGGYGFLTGYSGDGGGLGGDGGGGESLQHEASYEGNIGAMETARFFQIASPEQKQQLKDLIKQNKKTLAWALIQKVTKTKLQGKEFNEGLQQRTIDKLSSLGMQGPYSKRDLVGMSSAWRKILADVSSSVQIMVQDPSNPRHSAWISPERGGQWMVGAEDGYTIKSGPGALQVLQSFLRTEEHIEEAISPEEAIRSIVSTADSITKVYGDLKTMAEKWVYNNGTLNGFHRNAAGVGKRWYDAFFWNKMDTDLRLLLEKNPKAAGKLRDFFNIERNEKGHVSFTTIGRSLPRILNHVGEQMNNKDLKRFAAEWFKKHKDYEDYLGRVEAEVNDEEDDSTPAPKQPKDNVVGRQNAAAEDMVNQILRSIDKKAAGEIRNAIAREPNKLQALQRELSKRGIKVGEDIHEGKFRKRDIEEKLISNKKLNDLKSKYLPDWEMLDHRILQAKYVAKDHRHAEDFVSYINKISEEMDHFAEVTQDVAEVAVKTTTFDVKGLTILDFQLALKIDRFADRNDIEQVRMQGNFGMHEDIRKVKGGYRLVSKKSGRNLGTYPTKSGAEKREREVQYFKHKS